MQALRIYMPVGINFLLFPCLTVVRNTSRNGVQQYPVKSEHPIDSSPHCCRRCFRLKVDTRSTFDTKFLLTWCFLLAKEQGRKVWKHWTKKQRQICHDETLTTLLIVRCVFLYIFRFCLRETVIVNVYVCVFCRSPGIWNFHHIQHNCNEWRYCGGASYGDLADFWVKRIFHTSNTSFSPRDMSQCAFSNIQLAQSSHIGCS